MTHKLNVTIRNKKHTLVVCAILLLISALVTKLPFTETVARAAAKFLTSVTHDATLTGDGTSVSPLGIADASITNKQIRSGEVVRGVNNLTDSVTLVGGSNVTITPTGNNTLTVAANIPTSTPQPYINPRRVAALQWYEAIQTGLQYPAPPGTNQIAFDGDNLWVSRSLFGSVSKIRVSDGAVLGSFNVTGGEALGMAYDGANLWVACGDFSHSVAKLRASDGQNLGNFTLPVDPFSLAFDGSHIWRRKELMELSQRYAQSTVQLLESSMQDRAH